jgi:hypothetical protein
VIETVTDSDVGMHVVDEGMVVDNPRYGRQHEGVYDQEQPDFNEELQEDNAVWCPNYREEYESRPPQHHHHHEEEIEVIETLPRHGSTVMEEVISVPRRHREESFRLRHHGGRVEEVEEEIIEMPPAPRPSRHISSSRPQPRVEMRHHHHHHHEGDHVIQSESFVPRRTRSSPRAVRAHESDISDTQSVTSYAQRRPPSYRFFTDIHRNHQPWDAARVYETRTYDMDPRVV